MQNTGHSRKVDTNGRVIVPSQLRDRLDIRPGDLIEFCVYDYDGRTYLCFECPRAEDKIERAKRVLREAGLEI